MQASIALSEASALKDRLSRIVKLLSFGKKNEHKEHAVDPYDPAFPYNF